MTTKLHQALALLREGFPLGSVALLIFPETPIDVSSFYYNKTKSAAVAGLVSFGVPEDKIKVYDEGYAQGQTPDDITLRFFFEHL